MKLDELHIGYEGTRSVGHGNAVSCGNIGICCNEVNFAGTARGQNDKFRLKSMDLIAIRIENIGAETLLLVAFFVPVRADSNIRSMPIWFSKIRIFLFRLASS